MYRKKDKSKQTQLQMLCIEDLVPQDHMLREIENAIDWSFIYGTSVNAMRKRQYFAACSSSEPCEDTVWLSMRA